jgi:hypothetical protein
LGWKNGRMEEEELLDIFWVGEMFCQNEVNWEAFYKEIFSTRIIQWFFKELIFV